MSYNKIPAELRALKQWVLWKYVKVEGQEKPTKVPYQINGRKADVTDPATWNTYDNISAVIKNFSGLGFVFSNDDMYSGIDLDSGGNNEVQLAIFNAMNSYSEISPSGQGLHIIVKGTVPSGQRKDKVEVYSSNRFFTMTGNIYPSNVDKAIRECQSELMQLWEQLGGNKIVPTQTAGDQDEKYTDEEIIEQCKSAINGEKFNLLFNGRWAGSYPSQSEADYALIDFITFYTKNRIQIYRIFRKSSLGKRQKATRKNYIDPMINKSFDQTLPPLDFTGFKEALETKLEYINGKQDEKGKINRINSEISLGIPESNSRQENRNGYCRIDNQTTINIPPGLIGDIARFIYAAAPKPVPEIALAGALGLMAGICGRAYNVSATGLNQYILLLASTGTGKEAMSSGISRLMSAVKQSVPAAREFIGPSELASGQALVRYMDKTSKCFVSLFDEFDRRLRIMSDVKTHSTQIVLQQKLLEVYQKSGRGQDWQPSVFADSEKNTKVIDCPALTILGYCTPEKLYSELSEEMIIDGMLPRFSLIEYNGTRPETNYHASFVQPSKELENQVADLCAHCLKMMHTIPQQWIDVQFNSESWALACAFDKYCDNEVNSTSKEILRRLWTRAYLKALKLAGLIAVGCNYMMPTISVEHIQYAIDMVRRDITLLSAKFESGDIGKNQETRQVNEVIRVIKEYVIRDWTLIEKYMQNAPEKMHSARVVPYCYLNKRLSPVSCFNDGKMKASANLKNAIQVLIDTDRIREMSKEQLRTNFGTEQRAYMIRDFSIFND